MADQSQNSGMSKKASIALASVTAIAASDDIKVIVGIALVAIVSIVAQSVLDGRSG